MPDDSIPPSQDQPQQQAETLAVWHACGNRCVVCGFFNQDGVDDDPT